MAVRRVDLRQKIAQLEQENLLLKKELEEEKVEKKKRVTNRMIKTDESYNVVKTTDIS